MQQHWVEFCSNLCLCCLSLLSFNSQVFKGNLVLYYRLSNWALLASGLGGRPFITSPLLGSFWTPPPCHQTSPDPTPPPPRWRHRTSDPSVNFAESHVHITARCKKNTKTTHYLLQRHIILKKQRQKRFLKSNIFSFKLSILKFSHALNFRNNSRIVDFLCFNSIFLRASNFHKMCW